MVVRPFRGIDQQGDFVALDAVDDVGPAFPHLINLRDRKIVVPEKGRSAAGGVKLKALGRISLGQGDGLGLVGVLDAEDHAAFQGNVLPRGQLGLGKGQAEILVYAHDFPGGAHLRPQQGVHPGKAPEGKHRLFDCEVGRFDFLGKTQLSQGPAQHHLGGQLGQGDPGGLAHKGDGAGGPGIDFQDIDLVILDRELDVEETDHPQFCGQGPGLGLDFLLDGPGEGVGR